MNCQFAGPDLCEEIFYKTIIARVKYYFSYMANMQQQIIETPATIQLLILLNLTRKLTLLQPLFGSLYLGGSSKVVKLTSGLLQF